MIQARDDSDWSKEKPWWGKAAGTEEAMVQAQAIQEKLDTQELALGGFVRRREKEEAQ